MDAPNATGTSNSTTNSQTVRCDSQPACKAACDGGSFSGDKAECDYEEYKRWPNKPHCDSLKACYAKIL